MNRTNIPWVINPDGSKGFTANPIRGKCKHDCPYCYAWPIHERYGGKKEMTWHPEILEKIKKRKKPASIFIGSMYDIFGEWVPEDWLYEITCRTKLFSWHEYFFLTKNPQRYQMTKYSSNVWLGTTFTHFFDYGRYLELIKTRHKNLFLSVEPLLDDPVDSNGALALFDIQWLIIGSLNRNGNPVSVSKGGTRKEWVLPLIEQADKYRVPVFIKPELYMLYPDLPNRKEIPYLKEA
jgi:protein gp37